MVRMTVIALVVLCITPSLDAQTSSIASDYAAFNQLVSAFKQQPHGWSIPGRKGVQRLKIMLAARALRPSPAVPPDALAAEARGEYLFQRATSPNDSVAAAREFMRAIDAAPWVPAYYYNVCRILKTTPFKPQALHACNFYLLADPGASDADEVRRLVAGLSVEIAQASAKLAAHKPRLYVDDAGFEELHGLGGILGKLLPERPRPSETGQPIAARIGVDWRSSPPRHQVFFTCQLTGVGGKFSMYRGDLGGVSGPEVVNGMCDRNDLIVAVDPRGGGRVEFGVGRTDGIHTSVDALFEARRSGLGVAPLVVDAQNPTRVFAVLFQPRTGTSANGTAATFFETDCEGRLLDSNPRALPSRYDEEYRMRDDDKRYWRLGELTACDIVFENSTGANWNHFSDGWLQRDVLDTLDEFSVASRVELLDNMLRIWPTWKEGSARAAEARKEYEATVNKEQVAREVKQKAEQYAQRIAADKRDCQAPPSAATVRACTAMLEIQDLEERDRSLALIRRAWAFEESGQFDKALNDLTTYVASGGPYTYMGLESRASFFTRRGQYDRAIADYNTAEKLQAKPAASTYAGRGRAFEASGDLERALSEFNAAVKVSQVYLNARAEFYLRRGDFSHALADADAFIQAFEKSMGWVATATRGLIYLRMGQVDRALGEFNTCLIKDSGDVIALYGRGLARRLKGDTAGGDADIAEVARMGPLGMTILPGTYGIAVK